MKAVPLQVLCSLQAVTLETIYEHLPQSITGQLSKHTQPRWAKTNGRTSAQEEVKKQIEALHSCQARVLHTLTYKSISQGGRIPYGAAKSKVTLSQLGWM